MKSTTHRVNEIRELLDSELSFKKIEDQDLIISYSERHSFKNDITYHLFKQNQEYVLRIHKIKDFFQLKVESKDICLNKNLKEDFEKIISDLRTSPPSQILYKEYAQDGSKYFLDLYLGSKYQYYWEFPTSDFHSIQQLIKFIRLVAG